LTAFLTLQHHKVQLVLLSTGFSLISLVSQKSS